LCKGSDGYYYDCWYNSYRYLDSWNYRSSNNIYQDYGRDNSYNRNVIPLGRGFNRGYNYDRDDNRRLNIYYVTSSNDYRGYNRRYNFDRIPASYSDRDVFTRHHYLNNDRNRRIYLSSYNKPRIYHFEKWIYKKSHDCPRGWVCISGNKVNY